MKTTRRTRFGASRRVLAVLCAGTLSSACQFEWEPEYHERIELEMLEDVSIHAPDEALTFFRVGTPDGRLRLFAALRYGDQTVYGVDLSKALETPLQDPIEAFQAFGYDTLAKRIAAHAEGELKNLESFAVNELTLPVDLGHHHIAAGTNFPEHADEAGVEDGPYLFPKLVTPTEHDATVSVGQTLLDYEVEVGWVPLQPLGHGDRPEFIGMILCNDYTDRDLLLRHVNTGNVASGDGFTTGKSLPGFLPVGNLFVIPRDHREFAKTIQLRLYVNGWLRQRELLSRAVWDLDALVEQTWARQDQTWEHRGQRVSLFATRNGTIKPRTMLMSGTPAGVVFNELNVENKASGFFDFVLFGWGKSIPDHAIDNYIRDARAAGIYLQAGDEVAIHVDGLGVVRNEIVP